MHFTDEEFKQLNTMIRIALARPEQEEERVNAILNFFKNLEVNQKFKESLLDQNYKRLNVFLRSLDSAIYSSKEILNEKATKLYLGNYYLEVTFKEEDKICVSGLYHKNFSRNSVPRDLYLDATISAPELQ